MTAHSFELRQPRSYQVVPASEQRFLDKSLGLAADRILYDLEDGVAPSAKADARTLLAGFLAEVSAPDLSLSVRVNPWQTSWTVYDVLGVVGESGGSIDTIVLPKVDSPEHVAALDLLLTQIETEAGLEVGRIRIEIQIETAAALTCLDAICRSSPRLSSLIIGPLDLAASLSLPGVMKDGAVVAPLRVIGVMLLAAARARGLGLIDGPYFDIDNAEGLRVAAAAAAEAGYDGKWSIHPSQIDAINRAFTPTAEQLERAQAIVDAVEAASKDARGAARVDGEMVDEASRQLALAVLSRGRS